MLDWAHAIWSPFILESIMRSHGYRLVRRSALRPGSGARVIPEQYVEVY
jgi:hypothetical protein